jgi:hypothetical protein
VLFAVSVRSTVGVGRTITSTCVLAPKVQGDAVDRREDLAFRSPDRAEEGHGEDRRFLARNLANWALALYLRQALVHATNLLIQTPRDGLALAVPGLFPCEGPVLN